ncbi:MAG: hypothetical protein H6983_19265 [Ectothiorhodospiraceae bacterium]|nr:hypothetical protein [Chromatiales bacterium]MCP5156322.1 hypothetical protein [Ectothiorhodospiraceae bacterium]
MSVHRLLPGVLALAVVLGGCGFQLRGQAGLPEDVRSVYLEGVPAIADELEIFLESAGASREKGQAGSDLAIFLRNERYHRRVLSVDPNSGKEREFELVYLVEFDARRGDGTVLVEPQEVSILRDYVFDPDAVIGKSREEEVLREEMRRDAAQQILRRLGGAWGR